MSDRLAVVVAVAAVVGAWWSAAVPLVLASVLVVAALAVRWPWLLVIAVMLLSSSLGARAWAGLGPAPEARFEGEVTLVTDPVPVGRGMRVDIRAEGRRYEAWAYGQVSRSLTDRLAGDRLRISGSTRPIQPLPTYLAARHISNRLSIDEIHSHRDGSLPYRAANWLRRTIASGAESLDEDRHALFTGLAYGDDRQQSALLADDFRAAGLTHLLAVSGQNVAFALVLARPLIERFDYRGRWVLTLLTIGFFALVTRFEPSVLRATGMAGIAATATLLGREASSRRVLALTVALLVLIDPLLVHSVAFQLSVAASAGIILGSARLAERLPGPRMLTDAMAVTISAQLAVSPLLVIIFGGVPVASLPANLAAGPVAGPVMMWGLSGGVLAGLVGEPLAQVFNWPTGLGVGWIQGTARWAASARLGELHAIHVVAVVGAVGCWWLARRRFIRVAAAAVAVVVLVYPALVLRVADRPWHTELSSGIEVWRYDGSVVAVLGDNRSAERMLEDFRRDGVNVVDLVVATRGTRYQLNQVLVLRERMAVGEVVAPSGHRIGGAYTVRAGDRIAVGSLAVLVVADDPHLEVVVVPEGDGGGVQGVASSRDRGARAPPI